MPRVFMFTQGGVVDAETSKPVSTEDVTESALSGMDETSSRLATEALKDKE